MKGMKIEIYFIRDWWSGCMCRNEPFLELPGFRSSSRLLVTALFCGKRRCSILFSLENEPFKLNLAHCYFGSFRQHLFERKDQKSVHESCRWTCSHRGVSWHCWSQTTAFPWKVLGETRTSALLNPAPLETFLPLKMELAACLSFKAGRRPVEPSVVGRRSVAGGGVAVQGHINQRCLMKRKEDIS